MSKHPIRLSRVRRLWRSVADRYGQIGRVEQRSVERFADRVVFHVPNESNRRELFLVCILCIVGIVAATQVLFSAMKMVAITLAGGTLLVAASAILGRLPVRQFRARKLSFDENGWHAEGPNGVLADVPWADFGGYRFIQRKAGQFLEMVDTTGAVHSKILLGTSVYEFHQFPAMIEELDLRLSSNAVREHWPVKRGNVLLSLRRSTGFSILMICAVTAVGAWLLTAVSGWDLNTWLAIGLLLTGAFTLILGTLGHAKWVRRQALAREQINRLRWTTQDIRPLKAQKLSDYISLAAPFLLLSFGALVFVPSPLVGFIVLAFGLSGLENYRNLRCRGRHVFISNEEIVVQTKNRLFKFDPAETSVNLMPERMFLGPRNLLVSDAEQTVEVINENFGDEDLLEILNRVISNAKVDTPIDGQTASTFSTARR